MTERDVGIEKTLISYLDSCLRSQLSGARVMQCNCNQKQRQKKDYGRKAPKAQNMISLLLCLGCFLVLLLFGDSLFVCFGIFTSKELEQRKCKKTFQKRVSKFSQSVKVERLLWACEASAPLSR